MKTALGTMFATLTTALMASATPLTIETQVIESGRTVIHPTVSAESGQEVSVRYGDVECA